MFLAVAGPGLAADPRLDQLLGDLDQVPLAVELMACAAHGHPDAVGVQAGDEAEVTLELD